MHPTERTVTDLTPKPNASEAVVPEGVQKARAAFLRDFQALYADRKIRGRFVVYHQDRRVAVARTYRAACHEADRLGLPDGEHLIIEVSPGSEAWERAGAEEAEIDPAGLCPDYSITCRFPTNRVKSSFAASGCSCGVTRSFSGRA
jgi:hypothetical protein